MLALKDKELLFTCFGFNVHRPDTQESIVLVGIILVACLAFNFKYPSPAVWGFIGVVSMAAAAFDLIPPEKPLRTLLVSFGVGAALAFLATL